MPTMQFKCPVCKRLCRAYVDANVSFKCPGCDTRIKPHVNGKVDVVRDSEFNSVIQQNQRASTDISTNNEIITKQETFAKNFNEMKSEYASQIPSNQKVNDNSKGGAEIVGTILVFLGGLSVIIMGIAGISNSFNKPNSTQPTGYVSPSSSQPKAIIETPSKPHSRPITSNSQDNFNNSASVSPNETDDIDNAVFRTYYGKFTFDNDGIIHVDDFKLTIDRNQVNYEKGGTVKTFDAQYQGTFTREPQSGVKFLYHKFYLINKNKYLIVSDRKEVSHENAFYYRIIIDGQTQLAL